MAFRLAHQICCSIQKAELYQNAKSSFNLHHIRSLSANGVTSSHDLGKDIFCKRAALRASRSGGQMIEGQQRRSISLPPPTIKFTGGTFVADTTHKRNIATTNTLKKSEEDDDVESTIVYKIKERDSHNRNKYSLSKTKTHSKLQPKKLTPYCDQGIIVSNPPYHEDALPKKRYPSLKKLNKMAKTKYAQAIRSMNKTVEDPNISPQYELEISKSKVERFKETPKQSYDVFAIKKMAKQGVPKQLQPSNVKPYGELGHLISDHENNKKLDICYPERYEELMEESGPMHAEEILSPQSTSGPTTLGQNVHFHREFSTAAPAKPSTSAGTPREIPVVPSCKSQLLWYMLRNQEAAHKSESQKKRDNVAKEGLREILKNAKANKMAKSSKVARSNKMAKLTTIAKETKTFKRAAELLQSVPNLDAKQPVKSSASAKAYDNNFLEKCQVLVDRHKLLNPSHPIVPKSRPTSRQEEREAVKDALKFVSNYKSKFLSRSRNPSAVHNSRAALSSTTTLPISSSSQNKQPENDNIPSTKQNTHKFSTLKKNAEKAPPLQHLPEPLHDEQLIKIRIGPKLNLLQSTAKPGTAEMSEKIVLAKNEKLVVPWPSYSDRVKLIKPKEVVMQKELLGNSHNRHPMPNMSVQPKRDLSTKEMQVDASKVKVGTAPMRSLSTREFSTKDKEKVDAKKLTVDTEAAVEEINKALELQVEPEKDPVLAWSRCNESVRIDDLAIHNKKAKRLPNLLPHLKRAYSTAACAPLPQSFKHNFDAEELRKATTIRSTSVPKYANAKGVLADLKREVKEVGSKSPLLKGKREAKASGNVREKEDLKCSKYVAPMNTFIDRQPSNPFVPGRRDSPIALLSSRIKSALLYRPYGTKKGKRQPFMPPEGTVMPKLCRLPRVCLEDPPRICPPPDEVCQTTPRADAGMKVRPKKLPCLPLSDCPCAPELQMTEVPLERLKPRYEPQDPPRVCPVEGTCEIPRADANLQVKPKKLPCLVPGDCPCIENPLKDHPPLPRLKPRPVEEPQRVCKLVKFECPPRADEGLVIKKKKLPPLVDSECPCAEGDNLQEGPPLCRLPKMNVKEPERICPPPEEACPPRSDELHQYQLKKKKLETIILCEENNELCFKQWAEKKQHEAMQKARKSEQSHRDTAKNFKKGYHTSCSRKLTFPAAQTYFAKRHYCKVIKVREPCCPKDIEARKGRLADGKKKESKEERRRRLKFEVMERMRPEGTVMVPLARLKPRKGFYEEVEQDIDWMKRPGCLPPCDRSKLMDNIAARTDELAGKVPKRKQLPCLVLNNCKCVNAFEYRDHSRPLPRLKKRFEYKDVDWASKRKCQPPKCPRRSDEGLDFSKKKILPKLEPSDECVCEDIELKDMAPLKRLPPAPEEDVDWSKKKKCRPLVCPERADDGIDFGAKKKLPCLGGFGACQCVNAPELVDKPLPLCRLPKAPFEEHPPWECPRDPCELACRADDALKPKKKKLPCLLPHLVISKRRCYFVPRFYSTFADNPMHTITSCSPPMFNENFLNKPQGPPSNLMECHMCGNVNCAVHISNSMRSISMSSPSHTAPGDRKCRKLKPPPSKKKTCPKLIVPGCPPAQKRNCADKVFTDKECHKMDAPYKSYSDCKGPTLENFPTECPADDRYLQPKWPIVGNIILLKPPPPKHAPIDPLPEEECVLKKLGLEKQTGCKTCDNFHLPRKPFKGKELLAQKEAEQRAMAEAAGTTLEELNEKANELAGKCNKSKPGKDGICPCVDNCLCNIDPMSLLGKEVDELCKKEDEDPCNRKCPDESEKKDSKKDCQTKEYFDKSNKTGTCEEECPKRNECEEIEEIKCPVEEKSLWQKIVDFFKARPDCPSPDEWKKKRLREQAEKAAKAAGLELCEKKEKKICRKQRRRKKKKEKEQCVKVKKDDCPPKVEPKECKKDPPPPWTGKKCLKVKVATCADANKPLKESPKQPCKPQEAPKKKECVKPKKSACAKPEPKKEECEKPQPKKEECEKPQPKKEECEKPKKEEVEKPPPKKEIPKAPPKKEEGAKLSQTNVKACQRPPPKCSPPAKKEEVAKPQLKKEEPPKVEAKPAPAPEPPARKVLPRSCAPARPKAKEECENEEEDDEEEEEECIKPKKKECAPVVKPECPPKKQVAAAKKECEEEEEDCEEECVDKKEEKKKECKKHKKCPNFTLPGCPPRARCSCDHKKVVKKCCPKEPPYPSFSECKAGWPRLSVNECKEAEVITRKRQLNFNWMEAAKEKEEKSEQKSEEECEPPAKVSSENGCGKKCYSTFACLRDYSQKSDCKKPPKDEECDKTDIDPDMCRKEPIIDKEQCVNQKVEASKREFDKKKPSRCPVAIECRVVKGSGSKAKVVCGPMVLDDAQKSKTDSKKGKPESKKGKPESKKGGKPGGKKGLGDLPPVKAVECTPQMIKLAKKKNKKEGKEDECKDKKVEESKSQKCEEAKKGGKSKAEEAVSKAACKSAKKAKSCKSEEAVKEQKCEDDTKMQRSKSEGAISKAACKSQKKAKSCKSEEAVKEKKCEDDTKMQRSKSEGAISKAACKSQKKAKSCKSEEAEKEEKCEDDTKMQRSKSEGAISKAACKSQKKANSCKSEEAEKEEKCEDDTKMQRSKSEGACKSQKKAKSCKSEEDMEKEKDECKKEAEVEQQATKCSPQRLKKMSSSQELTYPRGPKPCPRPPPKCQPKKAAPKQQPKDDCAKEKPQKIECPPKKPLDGCKKEKKEEVKCKEEKADPCKSGDGSGSKKGNEPMDMCLKIALTAKVTKKCIADKGKEEECAPPKKEATKKCIADKGKKEECAPPKKEATKKEECKQERPKTYVAPKEFDCSTKKTQKSKSVAPKQSECPPKKTQKICMPPYKFPKPKKSDDCLEKRISDIETKLDSALKCLKKESKKSSATSCLSPDDWQKAMLVKKAERLAKVAGLQVVKNKKCLCTYAVGPPQKRFYSSNSGNRRFKNKKYSLNKDEAAISKELDTNELALRILTAVKEGMKMLERSGHMDQNNPYYSVYKELETLSDGQLAKSEDDRDSREATKAILIRKKMSPKNHLLADLEKYTEGSFRQLENEYSILKYEESEKRKTDSMVKFLNSFLNDSKKQE